MGAVACPHCQQPLAYVSELAGTQVICTYCQRQFRMPDVDPAVAPIAKAVSPPPLMKIEPIPDTSHPHRPRFRPRDYTALRALQVIFYVLAGICLIGLALGEAVVIAGGINLARGVSSSGVPARNEAPAGRQMMALATIIVPQFFLIFAFVWPAIVFFAAGQLISLMVDVQANTQEAAHYLRYLDR